MMDSNGAHTSSSSESRKRPYPPPVEILEADREKESPQSTQATPKKQCNSSPPHTPRHRRSKVHVDPAVALDAWNSSPRSLDFATSPREEYAGMKTASQFDFDNNLPQDSDALSRFRDTTAVARTTSKTWIQAGPEHGIDVVDWAVHEDKHTTLNDPVAPQSVSLSLLVNIYYPTYDDAPERTYVWDGLSATYDTYYGLPNGTFGNITANLAFNAKPLSRKESDKLHLPTLLFGPAFAGPPSRFFTGLISEMTSRGYPVVTVDHPWEAPYIEYPNGTAFTGHDVTWSPCTSVIDAAHAYRLTDNSAVLDALPEISKELGIPLDLNHFALFGHSLGGSAAVSQLLVERNRTALRGKKFLGAINIDGSFFGIGATNSSSVDVHVPSLLLSSGRYLDPSWAVFESYQSSWVKGFRILGHSNHTDFSDLIFLKQANGIAGGEGAITAERFLQVSRTMVSAFFGLLVGKGEGVLSGSAEVQEAFPEVTFDYNGTGNPCRPAELCWEIPQGC
ncbi:uncharacterized protein N0V89_010175 [Didymosphaeria variabile]|uniref:1-alkyl-2-acetylglycerophosphocholine esterase n=1 Tax=Didymosphaeria variabile TaxID=1932322 RepID=A0A9W8XF89_9PLEO|nr:uncharacterized protein N0V89_010175 [Didymosphaeria variabile]KAJ4348797.1 hypothetical protein N0V89_010175 [Didymosphaeria variabile]